MNAPRKKRTADSGAKPTLDDSPDLTGDIARRAYELFQARGGEPGHEIEDWLQAERQVLDDRTAVRSERTH